MPEVLAEIPVYLAIQGVGDVSLVICLAPDPEEIIRIAVVVIVPNNAGFAHDIGGGFKIALSQIPGGIRLRALPGAAAGRLPSQTPAGCHPSHGKRK